MKKIKKISPMVILLFLIGQIYFLAPVQAANYQHYDIPRSDWTLFEGQYTDLFRDSADNVWASRYDENGDYTIEKYSPSGGSFVPQLGFSPVMEGRPDVYAFDFDTRDTLWATKEYGGQIFHFTTGNYWEPFDPGEGPFTYSQGGVQWQVLIDEELSNLPISQIIDLDFSEQGDQQIMWLSGQMAIQASECSEAAKARSCYDDSPYMVTAIARYDGQTWKFFSVLDWWPAGIGDQATGGDISFDNQNNQAYILCQFDNNNCRSGVFNFNSETFALSDRNFYLHDGQANVWYSDKQIVSQGSYEIQEEVTLYRKDSSGAVRSYSVKDDLGLDNLGIALPYGDYTGNSWIGGFFNATTTEIEFSRIGPDNKLFHYSLADSNLSQMMVIGPGGMVKDQLFIGILDEDSQNLNYSKLIVIEKDKIPQFSAATPNTNLPVVQREKQSFTRKDAKLVSRLKGKIMLQVESRGEAWYIEPSSGKKYYLSNGTSAYEIMRKLGLGIKNSDLAKIPEAGTNQAGDQNLINRLKGKILLQVESHGEAWYINPLTGQRHYLKDPQTAYQLMKSFGTGIKNVDLRKIEVGEVVQ